MKTAWIAALLALTLSCAANAQDCKPLTLVGTAEMEPVRSMILVRSSVDGQSTDMIVDTGDWFRHLTSTLIKKLGLTPYEAHVDSFDITGHSSDQMVTVSTFQFGSFTAKNATFVVWPGNFDEKGEIGGLIGTDFLYHFDVDFDFAARKINFFSQDHCDGRVVYWHPSAIAVLPFQWSRSNKIVVPVTLDGVKMNAIIDTGAQGSIITMPAAQRYFGLTRDSPDVKKGAMVNGDSNDVGYVHRFHTLALDGVTISNPTLLMVPDLMRIHLDESPPTGTRIDVDSDLIHPPVILGLEELQHLHVYIAYKEKRLFISPAETPSPAVASGTPAH